MFKAFSQTPIPDPNFEQALIDEGIDNVIDGFLATNMAQGILSLNVSYRNIQDLTGIEAFSDLRDLDCSHNLLDSIDLSSNTLLHGLSCGFNSIDSLDLSNNPDLLTLYCNDNELTYLNVSNCSVMFGLGCDNNLLTNLDLSTLTSLESLFCRNNQITALNLYNNLLLERVFVDENPITELDLSQNPSVYDVYANITALTCLNLKNGNNLNMANVYAYQTPNLFCVEVDSLEFAEANWTMYFTNTNVFSEACNNSCSNSTSLIEFENEKFILFPNPAIKGVRVRSISEVEGAYHIYDNSGCVISNGNLSSGISTDDLNHGVYYVKFEYSGRSYLKKIVILP